jgi:proline dehydrogenase
LKNATKTLATFVNTERAFALLDNRRLLLSRNLFLALSFPRLTTLGTWAIQLGFKLRLPIQRLLKSTVYKQFCGGETLSECANVVHELASLGVGTTLDYAVEGGTTEVDFAATEQELNRSIEFARDEAGVRFSVFKPTGIASQSLLAKISAGDELTPSENEEWSRVVIRVDRICQKAVSAGLRIFIDAEESWYQGAVDALAEAMMDKYNRKSPAVYTTIQAYRRDRLNYLRDLYARAKSQEYYPGVKLVRGAYLEKERKYANAKGIQSAVFDHKEETDESYNSCLEFMIERIERIALCAATHNEFSSDYLRKLMISRGLPSHDKRVDFSQLYGMSDHISFNLAALGHNVSKYVPYGPVARVLPYLFRRAEENSSITSENRELRMIQTEIMRRNHTKN